MQFKDLIFLAADVWMIAVGFTYGIKFLRHYRNYLLGLEWIIVATSGTNFLVYAALKASEDSPMYTAAHFLDAFSRSVGITLILVLGLMQVTHRYKPSKSMDIGVFAFAAVVGLVIQLFGSSMGLGLDIFYVVVNVLTTVFLAYFSRRLWAIGAKKHAVWTGIATAAAFVIAATYDFVHIPGDDAQHTLFYIAALSTWGLQMCTYFYGYRALHDHNTAVDANAAELEPARA